MAFSRARFGILKESKATKEKFLKYLYKRPLKIFFDKVGSKAKAPKWGFARGFEGFASLRHSERRALATIREESPRYPS